MSMIDLLRDIWKYVGLLMKFSEAFSYKFTDIKGRVEGMLEEVTSILVKVESSRAEVVGDYKQADIKSTFDDYRKLIVFNKEVVEVRHGV